MYNTAIEDAISKKVPKRKIARKIFLSYPTKVFIDNYDLEFDIKNEISEMFNIPITSIQVCGSSKTGYSYHKNTEFVKGTSDLDIAIISQELYTSMMEIAFTTTKGFSDLTKFRDINQYKSYTQYLSKGILRPDLFPKCSYKNDWFNFFTKLSNRYIEYFENINAGVYCNELFFEHKQSDVVNKYQERIK